MDEVGTSRHSGLLVVPYRPGPLIELPPERRRDEIDDVLDDLFGEAPRVAPGPLDAVLVAGGAAAVITALIADLPGRLMGLGFAALGFGLILPLQHAWTRAVRARALRRVREVLGQGTPLDVSHPATRRLANAYRRLERSAGAEFGADALESAHLALVEVAGLLRGRPPQSPGERRYVAERTDAIAGLADRLERPAIEEPAEPPVDENALRDSAVQALRDLEERTGSGSPASMERMSRLLDEGRGPHGTA
jgi:hypothetical protein